MLCEKCKKNNATVHYRYNENGNITEIHLCNMCAKNEGLIQSTGSTSSGFLYGQGAVDDYFTASALNSLFGNPIFLKNQYMKNKICPSCGLSDSELRSGGKFGCPECYSVFSDVIDNMLKKMHLSNEYKGMKPAGQSKKISLKKRIENMREDMQKAVDRQEYEEAARLRDAIKKLENDNGAESGGENSEMVQ